MGAVSGAYDLVTNPTETVKGMADGAMTLLLNADVIAANAIGAFAEASGEERAKMLGELAEHL